MNEVIKDINTHINNQDTIIVATSGGPDSMCLLNILNTLKEEKNIKIICAHVNHKLREESTKEAKMVKDYCTKNNITYEYKEIENYEGNIENHAREERYHFFEKLLKKYNSKQLLTAHHGDDLIETMLMRISRGTNLDGYHGFSKITTRKNYTIYRPLISVTKEDIIKYLKKNSINYAIDKTNFEDKYTRNRFRKYILPPLKKENKNIHKNFIKLSETLKNYDNYINEIVQDKIKTIYKNEYINVKDFNNQNIIIKQKIIYNILKTKYKNNIKLIKDIHIDNIINLLAKETPNITLNLPLNLIFIKSYNKAQIKENKQTKNYDIKFKQEILLPNNHIIKEIEDTKEKSNYVLKLNSKEIELPIHIRNRKAGDTIEIKGLNGRKKIKDIFINEKIPKEERNTFPIVTDNQDTILWLPGLKKSKFDKSKTKNYDIIIKYF